MEIALGLDNDPDAQRTFEASFPEATFIGEDIAEVPASALDAVVDACREHPLLFNACAPCQPFSRQRRGATPSGDERLGLLHHVLRFVRRYRPELIFAENVPGLREDGVGHGVFRQLLRALDELGYSTNHRVVKSQDYGVPQRRARLVLLASVLGPVAFPPPTHGAGAPTAAHSTGRGVDRGASRHLGGRDPSGRPKPSCGAAVAAQPQTHTRHPSRRGMARLAFRSDARESPIGLQRVHGCLRTLEVGCAGARADDQVHQLLERAVRPPGARSGDQRP